MYVYVHQRLWRALVHTFTHAYTHRFRCVLTVQAASCCTHTLLYTDWWPRHRIVESLRLEKTIHILTSNPKSPHYAHWPQCHQMTSQHLFEPQLSWCFPLVSLLTTSLYELEATAVEKKPLIALLQDMEKKQPLTWKHHSENRANNKLKLYLWSRNEYSSPAVKDWKQTPIKSFICIISYV